MHVLAFRHVPFEGAGLMHPVLRQRGISIEYVDLYGGAAPPDIAAAAGLIFLGGPMSVNDGLPYLKQEMDFILAAVGRQQPVLGICLGAQLIAKALGAGVHRNPLKEIGWFDIHLTEAAAADPLFAGVNRKETVLHWHGETFDLPRGSVRLAYSDACANQAVRFADTVYGLQFHLEVTPAMIADWCTQDENCGDVRELDAPLDPGLHSARLTELSSLVFGHWCDLLAP
ncbi:Glutamine amidotransferase class-I [Candidatus Sulfopaludibacter sp. SbA6]|nr:Glutamine amidotransferase class-I [Candidatus Sulfopaludibacter sp. SbA6]